MVPEYRTSYKMYSAWNYGKEIEDLNEASEQGWQLVKGGCFHSRFEKNPDIQYRYQIDFGKIENMGLYIETFREQGWEYINSTFNGWHYFRKIYDPSLPEEAYEIFTDRESLHEMNSRWARLALSSTRPYLKTFQKAASSDLPAVDAEWNSFEVKYKDNYYIDLEMKSDEPLTVKIVDADGSEVWSRTAEQCNEKNIRVNLPKGAYKILFSHGRSAFDARFDLN